MLRRMSFTAGITSFSLKEASKPFIKWHGDVHHDHIGFELQCSFQLGPVRYFSHAPQFATLLQRIFRLPSTMKSYRQPPGPGASKGQLVILPVLRIERTR